MIVGTPVPTIIVGTIVTTMIAGTKILLAAVPTITVGTTVPTSTVGITVPTTIAGTSLFCSCYNNFCQKSYFNLLAGTLIIVLFELGMLKQAYRNITQCVGTTALKH